MQGFYRKFLIGVATLTVSFVTTALANNTPLTLSSVTPHLTDQPLAFTKNMGQWPDSILFRADANGAVMWFTKDGVYQQFFKHIPNCLDSSLAPIPHPTGGQLDKFDHEQDSIETTMIKTTFIASDVNVTIETGEMLAYKCNYFLGNDSSKWATDVPNYSSIIYKNIYAGIDLRYYGNGKRMEYDFVVSPGADPSVIKMQYDGAASVTYADNGDLVVKAKCREIIEQKPIVYSQDDNKAIPVTACFNSASENSFSFIINDYDKTQPLIIDPVLMYSTYLGGSGRDNVSVQNGIMLGGIVIDTEGNAYVTGSTGSIDFPTQTPFQQDFGGSYYDAFVTKFNSLGNGLIYSTYLGGSAPEEGHGIAIDANGNAYVTGYTLSENFPTWNPFQPLRGRSAIDAFVTKLNSAGNGLIYSTYLGGNSNDDGSRITIDAENNAYVTGITGSTDFPVKNPLQSSYAGGIGGDAFVTKLNSNGSGLIYSTYLGGTSFEYDIFGIAVDKIGNIYITGTTESTDFPTHNPLQAFYGGGHDDAFVTKLNSNGNEFIYSTYLGGDNRDFGNGIAVDEAGNAYLTGSTYSTNFPIKNPLQGAHSGPIINSDAFITKFNSDGSALIYSTFLGGKSDENWTGSVPNEGGIAIDTAGNVYVTGCTYSSYSENDFPIWNPFQASNGGGINGGYDAFVAKLNNVGNGLIYSTYLGGNGIDGGLGIAIDGQGNAYITGVTTSTNFPTQNPLDTSADGFGDAFVTKFAPGSAKCCVGMRGDMNNTGEVNVLDLNYLVSYFFREGLALCPDEANINGVGGINALDLNYLVSYFFRNGPPPAACP